MTKTENDLDPLRLDNLPQDVERDITRAQNVLDYLGLSDMRLMMILDIIVRRWERDIKAGIAESPC